MVPVRDNSIVIDICSQGFAECRICHDEDEYLNMEVPCACSGSVKYAHRKCVQRWCNEKGNTICEICNQPYESGYTTIPHPVQDQIWSRRSQRDWMEWSGASNAISQGPTPLLFSDYDYVYDANFSATRSAVASCCRSAATVMLSLVILQHTLMIAGDIVDDYSSFIMIVLFLKSIGFMLLCFITIRTLRILYRQTYQQEQDEGMMVGEVVIYFVFLFFSFVLFFTYKGSSKYNNEMVLVS